MTTNLPLGDGSDPAQRKVNSNSHDANNPKHFGVVLVVIPEDDSKDDASKIARSARASGYDTYCIQPSASLHHIHIRKAREKRDQGLTIRMRMHMWHKTEIRPVARLQEKRHPSHEPKHGIPRTGVRGANRNEKNTGDDGQGMDQDLLAPHACSRVDEIAYHTSQGSEHDVQKTEHGGPIAAAALLEGWEILEVVRAEDAVDSEFGAKGAEVGTPLDERLGGEDDREGLAEGGFDNNLASGGVEHLLLPNLGFVCETSRLLGLDGFVTKFLLCAVAGAIGACCCFVCELAWDIDDSARDPV